MTAAGGLWYDWSFNPFTNRLDRTVRVGIAADYTVDFSNLDQLRQLAASDTSNSTLAKVLATLIDDLDTAQILR